MHKVRPNKFITGFFTFVLLISVSVSGHAFVLCWSHDGHIHIEVTFNGVDCGHFPPAPAKSDQRQCLAKDAPLSTAPCYSCTDVPLAFPHHAFNHNISIANARYGKTAFAMSALPPPACPRVPQILHPDGHLKVPMEGRATLTQILSISLRI